MVEEDDVFGAHASVSAPAGLVRGHLYIISRLVHTHIFTCQSTWCPHTCTGSHVLEGRLSTDCNSSMQFDNCGGMHDKVVIQCLIP